MLFLLQLYKLNTDFHFLTLLFPLFTIYSFEKHWSSCSNDSEQADTAPLSLQVTGAVLTSDEAVGMTHTMCQPCLLKLALLREISFHSSRTAASSSWNSLLTLSLIARESIPLQLKQKTWKEVLLSQVIWRGSCASSQANNVIRDTEYVTGLH